LELNEDDFGEGTDVIPISGLELEQEKIMEEGKKKNCLMKNQGMRKPYLPFEKRNIF